MRTMHLFAGGGGGLLADLILGHTPIVAVEWEPYACQVLRERAAEGWFPGLRVWEGDVRLFDPSEYAGSVDCIHAGFPCQDISVAGKQAGVGPETRSGLYREVLRIAGIVQPRYLFLENVSAIVKKGLETVLADLATLGYDSEWLCLRASDCGANHQRDRWWLLATHSDFKQREKRRENKSNAQISRNRMDNRIRSGSNDGRFVAPSTDGILADSERHTAKQRPESDVQRGRQNKAEQTWLGGCDMDDSMHGRHQPPQGEICAGRLGIEHAGWWETEPDVGRVADGVPALVHRLKALGNAQVPLQAAVAWRLLRGE